MRRLILLSISIINSIFKTNCKIWPLYIFHYVYLQSIMHTRNMSTWGTLDVIVLCWLTFFRLVSWELTNSFTLCCVANLNILFYKCMLSYEYLPSYCSAYTLHPAKIKRCGEMARKLRFFREQMSKAAIATSTQFSGTSLEIDDLEVFSKEPYTIILCKLCIMNFALTLWNKQVKLGELEVELTEVNANNDKLQRTYNELVEYNIVLQKVWF